MSKSNYTKKKRLNKVLYEIISKFDFYKLVYFCVASQNKFYKLAHFHVAHFTLVVLAKLNFPFFV